MSRKEIWTDRWLAIATTGCQPINVDRIERSDHSGWKSVPMWSVNCEGETSQLCASVLKPISFITCFWQCDARVTGAMTYAMSFGYGLCLVCASRSVPYFYDRFYYLHFAHWIYIIHAMACNPSETKKKKKNQMRREEESKNRNNDALSLTQHATNHRNGMEEFETNHNCDKHERTFVW